MKSKLEVKKEIAKTIDEAAEILLYLQNKLKEEFFS